MNKMIHYMEGMIQFQAAAKDQYTLFRFMNRCKKQQVTLYQVLPSDNAVTFWVQTKDRDKLKEPAESTNVSITPIKKRGLRYQMYKSRKHICFAAGVLFFVGINLFLSGFIWNFEISGNEYYSVETITRALKEYQIYPGMRSSKVSTTQIASLIRSDFAMVNWVSVSIEGCSLVITIEENDDVTYIYDDAPRELAASESGTIISMLVQQGTPLVSVGDHVEQGDILVSSKVDVLGDGGEVLSSSYVRSEADIIIQTEYEYHDFVSKKYEKKVYTGKTKKLSGIRIGPYEWVRRTKSNFEQYDEYTAYDPVESLTEIYPIVYIHRILSEYELVECEYSDEEIQTILDDNFFDYLEELQENSIQIIGNSVTMDLSKNGGTADGTVTVNVRTGVYQAPSIDEEETANERD